MAKKRILLPPQFTFVAQLNRAFASVTFSDFLRENDAIPVMVIPSTAFEEKVPELVSEALEGIDGILLQGGNDVHPQLYGEEIEGSQNPQLYRDLFELEIIKQGIENQIPIFGVCRGFQLLNVALGGTLHQHLPYDRWGMHWAVKEAGCEVLGHESVKKISHTVKIAPDGVLRSFLGEEAIEVNSFHHQGIARLASGLIVEAHAEDGLIEAFSSEERRILGVQWHPESDFTRAEYATPLALWLKRWV